MLILLTSTTIIWRSSETMINKQRSLPRFFGVSECNMNNYGKPELLCPAGEYESLKYALMFGADAVYIAGKQFGMRTSSKNFDEETMKKAVEETHSCGKQLYVTCDTVPKSNEIEQLPD